YHDMQQMIERLQAQLGYLKGKCKDTPCVSDTIDPLSHKLENKNMELEFQVLNYVKENTHLKTKNKNLFNSISMTRAQTKTIIDSLQDKLHDTIYENAKLRAQLFDKTSKQKDTTKGMSVNTQFRKQSPLGKLPSSSGSKLYSVTPFLKFKGLPKIDESHALSKPVTSNLIPTPQESNVVKNDHMIAPGMFRINPFKTSREEDFVPNKPIKASARKKPITVSQPHVINKKDVNSDSNGLSSTGIDNTAKTRRPQPRSNTKNYRVPSASKSSCSKNKEVEVEVHPRNLLISKNEKHMSSECNNIKLAIRNDKSEVVCAMPRKKQKRHLTHQTSSKFKAEVTPSLNGFMWSMRVESINRKRYVLVIVDDYSRYTWAHFLRSKDKAPEKIKTFLKKIIVLLQALVIIVRTDNSIKFKNQVLKEYFDSVGISHQASFVRTPQQNRVVERRNQMLVEAARTMLIFSRAPLFLWAEVIATACYTQNRSIIHRRFDKTPYELINGRKLNLSFLHVFGALCYPKNDREDIGKLGAKGDIGFFIGYSTNSCAYRVYNRRTKKIIKTMNVTFDEISVMAFEQRTMYDEYIGGQPSAASRIVPAAPATQVLHTPTASTTTADTAPTPTNSSSQAKNIPNTSEDVDELEP
ncbi:retrovirus-related pol polyprotein from transposon TNT 1-94, partial [Tanacetum coccineum]